MKNLIKLIKGETKIIKEKDGRTERIIMKLGRFSTVVVSKYN